MLRIAIAKRLEKNIKKVSLFPGFNDDLKF